MFSFRPRFQLETERMVLRLPKSTDYAAWSDLRRRSAEFLQPWEPTWADDHLTKRAFSNRVYWAEKAYKDKRGLPLFMIRRDDNAFLGAITLDHVRRGPSQTGTFGYWIGQPYACGGLMSEAIKALVQHAFVDMGLSRIEAATLPDNVASRRVLEKTGFVCEGTAKNYLKIDGHWRTHVLYAALSDARAGKTDNDGV